MAILVDVLAAVASCYLLYIILTDPAVNTVILCWVLSILALYNFLSICAPHAAAVKLFYVDAYICSIVLLNLIVVDFSR